MRLDQYPDQQWLTVAQIADWLGISPATVWRRRSQSTAPLRLRRIGRRSGATAGEVVAWAHGLRTFRGR
jgi:predicted DNA-binding transcriptional regulator AlpA